MSERVGQREIRIGTSGWNYRHWKGVFYPDEIRQKDWFSHYASKFDTVEVNNTFYQLPAPSTFDKWRVQAPEGFVYTIKANRYITHVKRLRQAEEAVELFLNRARALGAHLGPILYQLPPRFKKDLDTLSRFLDLLPGDLIAVFEFRNPSWHSEDTFALLEGAGASFCAHDMPGMTVPQRALGRIAYARFHGGTDKYRGTYGEKAIGTWARWLHEQYEKGRDVYAYFNNDVEGHAPTDAARLRAALNELIG